MTFTGTDGLVECPGVRGDAAPARRVVVHRAALAGRAHGREPGPAARASRPAGRPGPTCPPRWANQCARCRSGVGGGQGLPEMGFTLGGLDEANDPQVRLLLALDAEERVLARDELAAGARPGRDGG